MSEAAVAIAAEEQQGQWCIFLPCSEDERWAVPQNALAEIVTLHPEGDQPPEELSWRGESVPVLDLGHDGQAPWKERSGGTGLVAVFLGLEGDSCRYWGLALRGEGLSVKCVAASQIHDTSEGVEEHASSAFVLDGVTYQVPDLRAMQRQIVATGDVKD